MRIWTIALLLFIFLSACEGSRGEEVSPTPSPEQPPIEDHKEDEGSDEEVEQVEQKRQNEAVLNEVKEMITSDFHVILPDHVEVTDDHFLSASVLRAVDYYEVTFVETKEPISINEEQLFDETPVLIVRGMRYATTDEAADEVGYEPVQDGMPEVDLNNGITGYKDAGAGSVFITWHEGRWSFMIRSRNDEAGNERGEKLAKEIVEKLEHQTLPPPHEHGAGLFSSSDNETVDANRLAWQEETIIYEVYAADPLQLIDIVTEMK